MTVDISITPAELQAARVRAARLEREAVLMARSDWEAALRLVDEAAGLRQWCVVTECVMERRNA